METIMKTGILVICVFATLLAGCGAPASTPAPEPALELVSFLQPGFGMRGLVPEGWVEALPGVYTEASSTSGIPGIYAGWYRGMSLRWVTEALVLPRLGVTALPQPSGQ